MKIIFLDIDGVLNSTRSMVARVGGWDVVPPSLNCLERGVEKRQKEMIDPVAVALLNRLTDADPSIRLVISSTHRLFAYNRGVLDLNLLKTYIRYLGVSGTVIGATPHIDVARGAEIKEWLNQHASSGAEPIESYIIIDDDSDMLTEQFARFVHTDNDVGLSMDNFRLAQGLLGITDDQLYRTR